VDTQAQLITIVGAYRGTPLDALTLESICIDIVRWQNNNALRHSAFIIDNDLNIKFLPWLHNVERCRTLFN
jgi:hypothetical protein